MKSFRFSLERVLEWRRTELQMEEAKLEMLHQGLARLAALDVEWVQVLEAAERERTTAVAVIGSDLILLERFRMRVRREREALAARMVEQRRLIAEQMTAVAEARRRVRLVERLRERRLQQWKAESDKELEELAGEFAIAEWRRQAAGELN